MKKYLFLLVGLLLAYVFTKANEKMLFSAKDVVAEKMQVETQVSNSYLTCFDKVEQGKTFQYFSKGLVNTNDLLWKLLSMTGPAELSISTWSMGNYVMNQFIKKKDKGIFTNARFLMDLRCKANKKSPLNKLTEKFDVRLTKIHAKIILLKNENWRLTAITSSNMQRNSRIEIGSVFTDIETFNFHYNWFNYEFDRIGKRGIPSSPRKAFYS